MGKAPKRHSAEFKFRVVLESIQRNSVADVAREHGIHPNQLTMWRKELLDHGAQIFDRSASKQQDELRKQIKHLQQLVGKKEVEIDVLKGFVDFYAPPDGR